ncbi:MAG: DUF2937 family protein [Pseudomonadota bacterium]
MVRFIALAGGIAGAASLSQFPEFSQQYLQRLAGAVDELRALVIAFDAAAQAAGISRDAALAELSGSPFKTELQTTLAGQITRFEALSASYSALRAAEPLERLALFFRFNDPDLARRTWEDFRPGLPITRDGLFCAGLGFAAGWGALILGLGGLKRLTRSKVEVA